MLLKHSNNRILKTKNILLSNIHTHLAISFTKLRFLKISSGGTKCFGISAGVISVVENSEQIASIQIIWKNINSIISATVS